VLNMNYQLMINLRMIISLPLEQLKWISKCKWYLKMGLLFQQHKKFLSKRLPIRKLESISLFYQASKYRIKQQQKIKISSFFCVRLKGSEYYQQTSWKIRRLRFMHWDQGTTTQEKHFFDEYWIWFCIIE